MEKKSDITSERHEEREWGLRTANLAAITVRR